MRSSDNKQRGIDSENRIIEYLSEGLRGNAYKIKFRMNDGNPDIVWNKRIMPYFEEHYFEYALEAKSVTSITVGEVGVIAITTEQWEDTKEYAEKRGMTPALIVEVIVKGSFKMYWLLSEKVVEEKMRRTMASFTVWQVVRLGERID